MKIQANHMGYRAINEALCASNDCENEIVGCLGQRFLCTGMSSGSYLFEGVPGNALGAYLNGASITVHGNVQDAVGDTMNDGKIVVFGSAGDALGYSMRGGKIFVKGDVGYRAGIHMKEYKEKRPVLVVGGKTGSFLGEYQAGGRIVVLGLTQNERPIVSNFPCAGMHGGKVYLRSDCKKIVFPAQVHAAPATQEDLDEILPDLTEFAKTFGYSLQELFDAPFTVVCPNSKNPYRQMYVAN